MRSEIVFDESLKSSCSLDGFAVSLALRGGTACQGPKGFASKALEACDYDGMTRLPRLLKPLLAGLTVTLLQLAMAVGLLAPEAPISDRYSALVQHDSYWFMNIIDRGYQTIVPPIDHKVMEVSNVAFFPAYPVIAALFRFGLDIDSDTALLITAQLAAWGFWSYFFLFCKRWNVPPAVQICGALTDRRPSSSVLPGRRLFRITIFDGACLALSTGALQKGSPRNFGQQRTVS